MWSRNLVNLFVSPLRPTEFATSVLLMGAIRTLLGMVPVSLLAWWFFGFSVYSMGLALAAFFASLILLDRKSVVWGTSVSVRVDLGGRRIIKNKKEMNIARSNI